MVHLAARIPTHHNDIDEASLCWQANALGTMKLVDAMGSAGVKRLIQTTSANAYAPWVHHPDELAPMFPTSRIFYLTSKIAQEWYANARGVEHGIGITTLRVSSVYGAASHRAPITLIARQMLDGATVRLVARGEFGADFVTDEDVAQALLIVLKAAAARALQRLKRHALDPARYCTAPGRTHRHAGGPHRVSGPLRGS